MRKVLAFIPVSLPMAMPPRLITGQAAWWEPFVALAILIVTIYGAILLGGKLYSHSLLCTGARIKWKEALDFVERQGLRTLDEAAAVDLG